MTQLDRIEAKLDQILAVLPLLIVAVAGDEEEQQVGMDGKPLPAERDQTQAL